MPLPCKAVPLEPRNQLTVPVETTTEPVKATPIPIAWHKRLYSRLRYPSKARRKGWEGEVHITVILNPDGSIKTTVMDNSSGFDILDEQALTAITKGAPYRPAPEVETAYTIPIIFRLK